MTSEQSKMDEVPASSAYPETQIQEVVDDSSAPESEGSTSESEDLEVEGSPKSRDADDKDKDDDDDHDDHDGQPSPQTEELPSSSTDAMTNIIILPDEVDEEFVDEHIASLFANAKNKDDFILLKSIIHGRAKFYVKLFDETKKTLKGIEKKERSEKKKIEKALEREEKKKQQKETRDMEITVNVEVGAGGEMRTISITSSSTVAMLRSAIGLQILHGFSKKQLKAGRIEFNGTFITEKPRKTLGTLGLVDGSKVTFHFKGSGGGAKRSRTSTKSDMIELAAAIAPSPAVGDPSCVASAVSMGNIDIKNWMGSLKVEQLEKMVDSMEKQPRTGNIFTIISPMLDNVKEFSEMTVS